MPEAPLSRPPGLPSTNTQNTAPALSHIHEQLLDDPAIFCTVQEAAAVACNQSPWPPVNFRASSTEILRFPCVHEGSYINGTTTTNKRLLLSTSCQPFLLPEQANSEGSALWAAGDHAPKHNAKHPVRHAISTTRGQHTFWGEPCEVVAPYSNVHDDVERLVERRQGVGALGGSARSIKLLLVAPPLAAVAAVNLPAVLKPLDVHGGFTSHVLHGPLHRPRLEVLFARCVQRDAGAVARAGWDGGGAPTVIVQVLRMRPGPAEVNSCTCHHILNRSYPHLAVVSPSL